MLTQKNVCDGVHLLVSVGFFVFNTNLTFLYKIDIEGFKKFEQKKLPPVGFELTTAAVTGLEF